MQSGKYCKEFLTGSGKSEKFRIFISVPDDVLLERKLARDVITQVGSEWGLRNRMDIEIVYWSSSSANSKEQESNSQDLKFEGIPKPEACDLIVLVLWSCIGGDLAAGSGSKEAGEGNVARMEWEYLNAIEGFRSKGKPIIQIYRREGVPHFAADDPQIKFRLDQWNRLEKFFSVIENQDVAQNRIIVHYQSSEDFHERFDSFLRDHLGKKLELFPASDDSEYLGRPTATQRWIGCPYPGLEAFTPEQGPIFFGRGSEIDLLIHQLANTQVRFIAVVGASGSGKSSLVKAGLLPAVRAGIVGNKAWCDLIFRPAEQGGDPFLALAFVLNTQFFDSEYSDIMIADDLRQDPKSVQKYLTQILQQMGLPAEVLIVIDQFEELFADSAKNSYQGFLVLLRQIVECPHLRIIVTLRSDFYARAIEEPILASLLRRDCGTFPLETPGTDLIQRMMTRPAEISGIDFEDGLLPRLLKDAGKGQEAMALIAFTLNQLYLSEQSLRYLSIAAYEALGKVTESVDICAERALQGLPKESQIATFKLFTKLVKLNEQGIVFCCYPLQSELDADEKLIADVLVDTGLLVINAGEDNQSRLDIAHQTVVTCWRRFNDWYQKQVEALKIRSELEKKAAEWNEKGQPNVLVCNDVVLNRYKNTARPLSSTASSFLRKSGRRSLILRIVKQGLIAVAIVFSLFSIVFFNNTSQYPAAVSIKALFMQLGIWPAPKPEMVSVAPGKFMMGDISGVGEMTERPAHTVHIKSPFEIGIYEVTFDEYDLFAAATGRVKPNSQGWGRGDRPVINVSWEDAVAYAQWLSERTGLKYRLPSEAEWEYAARATTMTPRFWDATRAEKTDRACGYANIFDLKNKSVVNSSYSLPWEPFQCEDDFPFTAPVGSFKPNKWGLYDMLGNVWEWTQDCYAESYEGAPRDGSSREMDIENGCARRVLRGGSWGYEPRAIRSAFRAGNTSKDRGGNIGFRLARTL